MNYTEEELEDFEIGENYGHYYLHGLCHIFAYHLNRMKLSMKFVVITEIDWELDIICVLHVSLTDGNNYYDIAGKHKSIEDMLDYGDFNTEIEDVHIVEEQEYKNTLKGLGLEIGKQNKALTHFVKTEYLPRIL